VNLIVVDVVDVQAPQGYASICSMTALRDSPDPPGPSCILLKSLVEPTQARRRRTARPTRRRLRHPSRPARPTRRRLRHPSRPARDSLHHPPPRDHRRHHRPPNHGPSAIAAHRRRHATAHRCSRSNRRDRAARCHPQPRRQRLGQPSTGRRRPTPVSPFSESNRPAGFGRLICAAHGKFHSHQPDTRPVWRRATPRSRSSIACTHIRTEHVAHGSHRAQRDSPEDTHGPTEIQAEGDDRSSGWRSDRPDHPSGGVCRRAGVSPVPSAWSDARSRSGRFTVVVPGRCSRSRRNGPLAGVHRCQPFRY